MRGDREVASVRRFHDRCELAVRGRGAGDGVQRNLDRRSPEAASSITAAAASSGPASSRPVPGGAQPSVVGYPPGAVSIGPTARISGPVKLGSSEASASGKISWGTHARSRTAVTPPASTSAGSASRMCTCPVGHAGHEEAVDRQHLVSSRRTRLRPGVGDPAAYRHERRLAHELARPEPGERHLDPDRRAHPPG